MLSHIQTAFSNFPCRVQFGEDEKAVQLPVLRFSVLSDENYDRCDGQDYLRKITCQTAVFSFSGEEAREISKKAGKILTGSPFFFSRTLETTAFDHEGRVYSSISRYETIAEKEDV